MVIESAVVGNILFNDGEFAEIQTVGKAGIGRGLLIETFQINRLQTNQTSKSFLYFFPVGMKIRIHTRMEIIPI